MADYLVLVDHECEVVRNGGKWFIYEGAMPSTGTLPRGSNPLPSHGCRRGEYSQACESDDRCDLCTILKVLPYTARLAKKLEATRTIRGPVNELEEEMVA